MKYEYIPPFEGPLSEFPKDTDIPEGVRVVSLQDDSGMDLDFYPNVVYDRKDETDLHLQVFAPRPDDSWKSPDETFPIVLFVQGSAWMEQAVFLHISQIADLAKRGYVVAIVQYRHTGIAPFPAQAEDAKTAIRFMKLHAAEYHGDPNRVVIWGDSSGGHTALMSGLTGDSFPDNKTYAVVSAKVNCVVDWYGPTNISSMNAHPSAQDHMGPESPEGRLIGFRNVAENEELARATSPMTYLSADVETPPLLIMHGNRDQLVCFQQSVELLECMRALDKNVEMICLDGAYHGTHGFKCAAALDLMEEFMKKYI